MYCRPVSLHYLFFVLLVAYRMYNYSIFAATSVGEGPSADGSFLTGEDGEMITSYNNFVLLDGHINQLHFVCVFELSF